MMASTVNLLAWSATPSYTSPQCKKGKTRHVARATLLRARADVRTNSIATEVSASSETEAPPENKERKPAPLERGGTLAGEAAAGKDPGAGVKPVEAGKVVMQIVDGYFKDYRWKNGRWDLSLFTDKDGKTNWDAVIDAEMARRALLEASPIPSVNEDPVNFDTAEIPWWAWVRRFHLPEAEKLNGRAAMMGYLFAWLVDSVTGAGLVDQQNSFLGKLALHVIVFGVLLVRNLDAIPFYKGLLEEATFYDKQWNAAWEGQKRPSEKEDA
eukprot:jgi/Botrbrau1/2689/Bobra.0203s0032.1